MVGKFYRFVSKKKFNFSDRERIAKNSICENLFSRWNILEIFVFMYSNLKYNLHNGFSLPFFMR